MWCAAGLGPLAKTFETEFFARPQANRCEERRALGEDRYKREFLGIPTGGQVSPFTWELYDRATQTLVHPASRECRTPTIIAHDVGHTKDRSTAVIGGGSFLDSELTLIKEFNELPQGLYGSARLEPRHPKRPAPSAAAWA
jgi:hypothetical protein